MSICAPCTRLQDISLCTDELIIGEAPTANSPYTLYFRSLATDATYIYAVDSDADGMIVLTLSDGFPLASGQAYEMWITDADASIDSRIDLIISSVASGCYTISGRQIYDLSAGYFENYPTQTLARL